MVYEHNYLASYNIMQTENVVPHLPTSFIILFVIVRFCMESISMAVTLAED
jgi:hypothetical protein